MFDWSCLDEFERPFMLAGGIDSTNVARAIRTVRPYGIDISSGIETDGVKDDEKIKSFYQHCENNSNAIIWRASRNGI